MLCWWQSKTVVMLDKAAVSAHCTMNINPHHNVCYSMWEAALRRSAWGMMDSSDFKALFAAVYATV